MMRPLFYITLRILYLCLAVFAAKGALAQNGREVWLQYLDKVAKPVMYGLANDELKASMPVELSGNIDNATSRKSVSYLEAFGRTLSGIAPWLEGEGGAKEEVALRSQYRQWALQAIANAVNPKAADYLIWQGGQPLVDASFFAFALVRSPWLWHHLDSAVQQQVITALESTRATVPVYSNWLLFSGMIEAFFCKYNLPYDPVRIDYAIREFAEHWYVGDGFFSDGMNFHMDYYNSIVIHPFLSSITRIIHEKTNRYDGYSAKFLTINQRYAEIQERDINTDGSYPVIGRSITYRCGVFHHLADMALRKELPSTLQPAQVRGALAAVVQKTLSAPGTFANGWLSIGLYGAQPLLGEFYITTGSLYLCAEIFLPLGLPPSDPFWSDPPAPWTSVKVWSGQKVAPDHAEDIH